jgi:hypothetical protein
LLEAVFDERAARGGLHRVADVMAGSDPQAALLQGLNQTGYVEGPNLVIELYA